jgi:hypothetical protein
VRIPRARKRSTHFCQVPWATEFRQSDFFVDFICSEPSPHMREAMLIPKDSGRSFLVIKYCVHTFNTSVCTRTCRSRRTGTDRRTCTENTKRQDLFREINLICSCTETCTPDLSIRIGIALETDIDRETGTGRGIGFAVALDLQRCS